MASADQVGYIDVEKIKKGYSDMHLKLPGCRFDLDCQDKETCDVSIGQCKPVKCPPIIGDTKFKYMTEHDHGSLSKQKKKL